MGGEQLTPAQLAAALGALLVPGDDLPGIIALMEKIFIAIAEEEANKAEA